MAEFQHVSGSTGCLLLKGNCIPVYRISRGEWILMDSGSGFDGEELFSYLTEHDIQVRAVLTSHAHYDHVGNHRRLGERFGCECIMTAFDAGTVRDTVALKSCFYSCTQAEIKGQFADMVSRADRVIREEDKEIAAGGGIFKVIPIPGHAASQVGFITPDGVAYLGDCLLGPEQVRREKMVYMLDWKTSLDTMRQVQSFDGQPCILSHYGVHSDIKAVAEANIQAFETVLSRMEEIMPGEFLLEEIVKRAVLYLGIEVKSIPRARLVERMVRSLVEYMVETGGLQIGVREGVIVYTQP